MEYNVLGILFMSFGITFIGFSIFGLGKLIIANLFKKGE